MRRVPEWLPEALAWHNYRNRYRPISGGAIPPGFDAMFTYPEPPPTRMDLIVYPSPGMVAGLLMTETTHARGWYPESNQPPTEMWFFGYRCSGCHQVFLITKNTRRLEEIERDIYHECDPSDLRRAVRNARELARDRGEFFMEGSNGAWWPERLSEWDKRR